MNKLSFKIVITILSCASQAAVADTDFAITLVQPGAGFLVAGEESQVPLEIILQTESDGKTLKSARVRASLGAATKTKIVAKNRLLFMYTPPASPLQTDETIDAELLFSDGTQSTHSLGFPLAKPHAPRLSLSVSEIAIEASRPKRINLSASASSPGIERLEFFVSHGELEFPGAVRGGPLELFAGASFTPPLNMPSTEPSHFMILAVATSKRGFSAQVSGVSTYAKVRVRAELPPGSKLVLEGPRNPPPPVRAPADGYTTSYAVIEYGLPFHAFRVRGRRKKEISVTLPRGIVPDGLAVAIPGQDVADGGTGPSILVAIPPSPFSEELYWPEITLEGADNFVEREVSDRIHALSFTRPKKPKVLTVLADRIPIGTVEFKSSHGARLELQTDYAQKSERGAIFATVFDPMGGPADYPIPVARIEDGRDLPVTRVEAGKFRISLPSNTPGDTDNQVRVTVELPSPKIVHGDPPELVSKEVQIALEGPAPAIRPNDSQRVEGDSTTSPQKKRVPLGIGLQAVISTELILAPQLSFGGGLKAEIPLSAIHPRLSLLGGLEFHQFVQDGLLAFGDGETLPVKNTTASFVIPLELAYRVFDAGSLRLSAGLGGGFRFDYTVLDQLQARIASSKTSQIAGRAKIALHYQALDFIGFVLELGIKGLGASAATVGSGRHNFNGSYTRLYTDLGVRLSI